jgi:hypothetical protein
VEPSDRPTEPSSVMAERTGLPSTSTVQAALGKSAAELSAVE